MGDRPDIFALVHADLDARNEKGRQSYGDTLRPFDGRNSHKDLYEELVDAVVYERKRQVEREAALAVVERLCEGAWDMHPADRGTYLADLETIRAALGSGR